MKRNRMFFALVLVLSMLGGLAAPAAAAGPALTVREGRTAETAQLVLTGLSERVYALQLELTLNGGYDRGRFTPDLDRADVYSPNCQVMRQGRTTHVTIYLTSRSPLNEGKELSIGVLELDRDFLADLDSAEVVLLGRDSEELDVSARIPISTENGGGRPDRPAESPSEPEDKDDAPRYRVEVQPSDYGSIRVSEDRAERGETVTVTAAADSGCRLDSLSVTTRGGEDVELTELDQRHFTFRMPDDNVSVSASFVPSDVPPTETEEPEPAPLPFLDVLEDDWYYEYVRYVYQQNMMAGTAPDAFSPSAITTRGMIVTILHRLEGTPAAVPSSFPDVAEGQYYSEGVAWAAVNGIVNGYDTGLFGPYRQLTREQLATILYRYAQVKGYSTAVRGSLAQFTDGAAVSDYAVEAMSWAVGSGLISGIGDNLLDPGGSATRAQLAAILMRFCENVAG